MLRVYVGAIMIVAGIAAFIEAHSNRPMFAALTLRHHSLRRHYPFEVATVPVRRTGLSSTGYDLLRVSAWALVILGAVTLVIGVVQMMRRQP